MLTLFIGSLASRLQLVIKLYLLCLKVGIFLQLDICLLIRPPNLLQSLFTDVANGTQIINTPTCFWSRVPSSQQDTYANMLVGTHVLVATHVFHIPYSINTSGD